MKVLSDTQANSREVSKEVILLEPDQKSGSSDAEKFALI